MIHWLNERVQALHDEIGRLNLHTFRNLTLWMGVPGMAVFAANASSRRWVDASGELPQRLMAHVLDFYATQPPLNLYRYVWSLWAARHVDQCIGDIENSRFCDDLDTLLLEHVAALDHWPLGYDLVSGLLATGVYALSLKDSSVGVELRAEVLRLLMGLAVPANGGLVWRTEPGQNHSTLMDRHPGGYHDLGLAHGNAAVLLYLASACEQPEAPAACREWLYSAALSLSEMRNPEGSSCSFSAAAEERGRPERSAWCYGDLGVAWALSRAAQCLQSDQLTVSSREVLSRMASRSWSDLGLDDVTLCHGAPGLAHMAGVLCRATGAEAVSGMVALRDLALERSRRAAQAGRGGDMSYLEGRAGQLLALMDAQQPLASAWDFPMMLA